MIREPFEHRLWIFCSAADVAALRQVAVDASAAVFPREDPEAQRSSFALAKPGLYGASIAATETLRTTLASLLATAIGSGAVIEPVAIVRLANGSDTIADDGEGNPVRYTFGPSGPGVLPGPGSGDPWTFAGAVESALDTL